MVARAKAWVCSPSIAVIAGSNPSVGMDVYLVSVVRYMSFLAGITCPEES